MDEKSTTNRTLRIGSMWHTLLATSVVQLALSGLLGVVVLEEVPASHVVAWVAAVWGVLALRALLLSRLAALPNLDERFWEWAVIAGAIAVGGGWGLSSLLFLGRGEISLAEAILLNMLGGVSAAGGVLYANQPRAAVAFLAGTLFPVIAVQLYGGGARVIFAGAVALHLVSMLAIVTYVYRVARGASRVRLHNAELVSRLDEESRQRVIEAERARIRELEQEAEHDGRYRELVAQVGDPILFVDIGADSQLSISSINPAAERLLDTPAHRVQGSTIDQILPEGPAQRLQREAHTALADGASRQYDEIVVVPFGEQSLEVTVIPIGDRTGRFHRLVVIARDVTEERRTEQTLRRLAEQEARLSGFVASVPGFLYSMQRSPSGALSLRFVTEGIREVYGIAPHAATAQRLLSLIHPDDLVTVTKAMESTVQTLDMMRVEYRILHPERGERWIDACAQPIREPDGSTTWNGMAQDVTERKGTQRNLELLNLAIDLTGDAVYLIDEGLCFAYVNDTACRRLGYSREELLTMGPLHIDPDVDSAFAADMLRTTPVATVVSFETRHRTREGEVFPVEICGTHFIHEGRKFSVSVARDITERKRQQQRTAMMEYALDHIHDAAYVLDTTGQVVYVNEAACRELGYSRDELQTMSIYEFDHELTKEQATRLKWLVNAQRHAVIEAQHRRRNGQLYPVEVTISPSLPFNGRQTLVCLARNMTRQKEAARALAEREAELQRRADFQEVLLRGIAAAGLHVVVSERGRLIYSSDGGEAGSGRQSAFGSTAQELAGQSDLLEHIHPEDWARVADYYRRRIAGEDVPGHIEFGVVAPDGTRREFEAAASVLPGPGPVRTLTVAKEITQRKRAEIELRQALELTEGVINAIPDLLFEVDRNGVYLDIWTPSPDMPLPGKAELLGKSLAEVLPPDAAATTLAAIAEADASGGSFGKTILLPLPAGHRWFELSVGRTKGSGANRFIILSRDITERRHMQELLAARERELRTLVENMPDVVVRYDLECRRSFVSPSYSANAGIARETVLGKRPTEAWGSPTMPPELFEEKLRGVMASGRSDEIDLEWWTQARQHVCLLMTMVPEFDQEGRVASVLTVARNVSELKRAEALLYAREEAFRTLAENSPDTIARYDRGLRRIYVNPAFVRLAGLPADELLGMTPAEYPGGESAALYVAKMQESFDTGVETGFELTWRGRDGLDLCSHIRIAPERDRSGEIVSLLVVGRDITEIDGYRRRIFSLAFYDTLTGLANRALFNDRLHKALQEAERRRHVTGVLVIDLDRFKTVNDSLGHGAGDELLREAGTRLIRAVRGYDTAARLGGDEFAILLPEIRAAADAGIVANKVLGAFARPFMLEGRELFVSASVGIALYPEDGATGAELLKHADSAMYHAKSRGRNNFQFYRTEMTVRAEKRLELEASLRRALGRGEFSLHYQPQLNLASGCLVGAEALLRWHNPTWGYIPPDHFISIAEDTGLIVEIGEWVLHEACRAAAHWNCRGNPVKVAVNLSSRQFRNRGLIQAVQTSLEMTGCRPEWLELEITESLLLEENAEVREMMEELRARGHTFAIDDFGTGYSALGYLRRFPIDKIKIDRSFINDIDSDQHAAGLVRAIITMAEVLGLELVAEGVETDEQCDLLHRWGGGRHAGQGFLFGRPMPECDFERMLLAQRSGKEVIAGMCA